MEPVQAEEVTHNVDLIHIQADGPETGRWLRKTRITAAKLVVEDHSSTCGTHGFQRFKIVMSGARSAVQRKEWELAGLLTTANDPKPGPEASKRDVPLMHACSGVHL
jgi:hypothetical protein